MSTSIPDMKQQIETLKTSLDILTQMFETEIDIHTYTRQIGAVYPQFYAADRTHNLSTNTQKLEEVIQAILQRCPATQKNSVTTVLNTIRATTGADNETCANLQELLIRTWSLVNNSNNYKNAFQVLMDNLDHNIATGGGCVPGIAARLIQPYIHFVLHMLRQAYEQSRVATPSVQNLSMLKKLAQNAHPNDIDPMLAEALRLSLLELGKENKNSHEDRELERVLQLSAREAKNEKDSPDPALARALQLSALTTRLTPETKPKKGNEDPALAEALRLSALEAQQKADSDLAVTLHFAEVLKRSKFEK
jgi:hypothetical protein